MNYLIKTWMIIKMLTWILQTSAMMNCKISEHEVRCTVFKQIIRKASGADDIPTEIIKASYEHIAHYLVSIYNTLFENADYLESWGLCYIIPLFKEGDPNQAKNYRGITLNSIYSQILLNRLTTWTEKHEKNSKFQFGYEKGKSTTDCIFILHSILSKVKGKKIYLIFIDYEKCYDKIIRLFLWQKLLAENVCSKMTKVINSIYTVVTCKSAIKYNRRVSNAINSQLDNQRLEVVTSFKYLSVYFFKKWKLGNNTKMHC